MAQDSVQTDFEDENDDEYEDEGLNAVRVSTERS
jgi:hypothetical protein